MTTKPKAQKFRIRRGSNTANAAAAPEPVADPAPVSQTVAKPMAGAVDSPSTVSAETDIDAIRQEGLTGRQLRMARRVAQKNGLAVTSDFDAVRQLRQQGVDPFQRANVLELVAPNDGQAQAAAGQMRAATAKAPAGQTRVQLPQTVDRKQMLPSTQVGTAEDPAERRASEIRRIQKDIAKRRRRNIASLLSRLAMFVFLPTIAAGYYFYEIATPMYGTDSQLVIKQAGATTGGGGLGDIFGGTGLATQTDSTTVQFYMTSREAFNRLDEGHGFVEHFSDPDIDSIQRLPEDATRDDAYALFQSNILVGYDPTEGFIKMEVIAADPAKGEEFSRALIGFAEEQINEQTLTVREDSMSGARQTHAAAEQSRVDALAELVSIQEELQRTDPTTEAGALQQRITPLEIQLDDERLNLASLLNNRSPNAASVASAETEIRLLEDQIARLRGELSSGDGGSLVSNNARLRQAEENYAFAVTNVQATLVQMNTAEIEASRQSLYLTISVPPIAPDSPTYPQSFENTLLAFLILSGIYLMISLTASILREQVSS